MSPTLLEESQPGRATPPPPPRPRQPDSRVVGGLVRGVTTQLVVQRYTEQTLLCVTQLGRLGTLLQVERETARPGETNPGGQVFTAQLLLGQESEEARLLARVLCERANLPGTLLLAIAVKHLTVPLALELVDFVLENL